MRKIMGACAISLLAFMLSLPAALAQTVRVEGENYLLPPDSGPNETDVVQVDNTFISFFVSWDYVEWDVNIPEDGTYSISFNFASDWAFDNIIPIVLTFWTSGQQVIPTDFTKTAGWGDFQTKVLTNTVALKAGPNRFRVQVRPDNSLSNRFGSGMNLDWIEFTKVGNYPARAAITGKVTASVGGTPAPLEGAIVSVGAQYTAAEYVTRTDAEGNYTLNVPAGSNSVTVFHNGFARSTADVTAPGTHDVTLTYNGLFEAELFQVTNPGPGDAEGLQPAYNTTASNNGMVWAHNWDTRAGKYAEWRNIVVPEAGVYELSLKYAGARVSAQPGYGRYAFSANGGPPVEVRYAKTFDVDTQAPVFQDSGKVLLQLEEGLNTIRLENPDGGSMAYIDTFTLVPATMPHGTIRVLVTNQADSQPLPGASVTIVSQDATINGVSYSGATDASGIVTVPAPVGSYTVTANTATAAAAGTANAAVAANQVTEITIPLTLTATAIEAEAYVNAGPGVPSTNVVITNNNLAASGGKEVTGFTGDDRKEWLEWVVNAAEDGLYEITLRYNLTQAPARHKLNVWSTSYQVFTDFLPFATGYSDYIESSTVPLKAGPNVIRLTMLSGSTNIDYIKLRRVGALPSMGTITGIVRGSDGTGNAPIRNARVFIGGDADTAEYLAITDATGAYTLNASTGAQTVLASASGYTTSAGTGTSTGSTADITLDTNQAGALQIEAEASPSFHWDLTANDNEITISGPGKWFDIDVSAPRSGLYRLGMNYSSGWNPGDGLPVKTTWSVNDVDFPVEFPTTTAWDDYQTRDNAATIPLNAGPNTIRVTWVEKGSNFDYFTLTRTGDLPVLSTDIDNNGTTDIRDAALYNRRLNGLDTGATPDVDGNGVSNAQDVKRILRVAGGMP